MALVPGEACAMAGSVCQPRAAAITIAAAPDTSNAWRIFVLFIGFLQVLLFGERTGITNDHVFVRQVFVRQKIITNRRRQLDAHQRWPSRVTLTLEPVAGSKNPPHHRKARGKER